MLETLESSARIQDLSVAGDAPVGLARPQLLPASFEAGGDHLVLAKAAAAQAGYAALRDGRRLAETEATGVGVARLACVLRSLRCMCEAGCMGESMRV